MEIRLLGDSAETDRAVAALRAGGWDVRSVSPWYSNLGATRLGRVYVDAVPPRLPHRAKTPDEEVV